MATQCRTTSRAQVNSIDFRLYVILPPPHHCVCTCRSKADDVNSKVVPYDSKRFPQFKTRVMKANVTSRASARTYFYATEKKCNDVMINIVSSINVAG